MRVGLFVDMRNPTWCARPWDELASRTIETLEHADAAGAASAWFTEHHGFPDGYLGQPLTLAAAVAARTRRMRIGTAVVLAALRHPLHLAEQAALVDVLSAGRLELGLGAGYRRSEYAAAGVADTYDRRFTRTLEVAAEVRRLLADGSVATVQHPIPLWFGFGGPHGARRAGRFGGGLLSLDRRLLDPYLDGLRDCGHEPGSARMGGVVELILSDDPERDARRLLPHIAHQQETYRAARFEGGDTAAPHEITEQSLAAADAAGRRRPGARVVTAHDAIREIQDLTAGLPVEHVYLWLSIAGMPDDIAARHVELVSTVLAPALARSERA